MPIIDGEVRASDYNGLSDQAKEVVAVAKAHFADCFDNDEFGPFIEEFTGFGDDRWAMFLELGLGDIQVDMAIPEWSTSLSSYRYTAPVWHRTLVLATVIEAMQHLVRSYVEIPDDSRVGAPTLVRRDYMDRWQRIIDGYRDRYRAGIEALQQEAYNDMAGRYIKTLVDYRSMAGAYIPYNSAQQARYPVWW